MMLTNNDNNWKVIINWSTLLHCHLSIVENFFSPDINIVSEMSRFKIR